MFRAAGVCRDVRQVHLSLLCGRQFNFGFFSCVFQALQSQHILLQVDAAFFLEFFYQEFNYAHVKIFAAEEGVAVGGQHFKLVFTVNFSDVDNGNIESAAAQVIYRDFAVAFLLIHTKCQRSCSRFINDALYFQAGNAASVLGGLALTIVEVGRHCDDSFSDRLTEIILGGLFHFHEYLCGDFRNGNVFVTNLNPCITVLGLNDGIWHHAHVLLHHWLFKTAPDQPLYTV